MMKRKLGVFVCSIVSGLLCIHPPVTDAQYPGLLKEKTNENGISYISGGIGSEEREELKRVTKDYSLKLMLSEAGGAYLGAVEVTILNSEGRVILKDDSSGPWFLVKLQNGRYRVRALARNMEKTKDITISGGKLRVIHFQWPGGG
jgi:hypothetical protein